MNEALQPFVQAHVFGPLNARFAEAMARLVPDTPPLVIVGAAAASAALSRGDICLELGRARDTLRPLDEGARLDVSGLPWPEPEAWRAALAASPLVTVVEGAAGRLAQPTPLVLEGQRLYLHRYWDYQRRLAATLLARRERTFPIDRAALAASLDRLFGAAPDPDQRRAAELAVERGLAIISGGPGTGNTSTVVRILAALLEQEPTLSATLVAPTGKAAARLAQSIREQRAALPLAPDLKERLPEDAATIHRRLDTRMDQPTRFRHDAENPLPADVVVLDEASMVDLALMTKLLEAVRPEARLILLGDKDQLASVAAGHVLGDIAQAAGPRGALASSFSLLRTSHRFVAGSGIDALARAIQAGASDEVLALCRTGGEGIQRLDPDEDALRRLALAGWIETTGRVLGARAPEDALAALGRFQILCAHRRGRWGSERLTVDVAGWLAEAGAIQRYKEWYPGRPVIVTVNDAALGLFNGDVGLTLAEPEGLGPDGAARGPDERALRVYFERVTPTGPGAGTGVDAAARTRALAPSQLPTFDPFYATTVHKAQGSGFDEVVVVLPPEPSPVLTRELLYTAVTRARRAVTLVASEAVLVHTVKTRVERASGLGAALAAPPPRA
ncbi:MAG: exodeoxyribonuclease V subunit alpha [Deltaproteobacteria bacterium]|nr:exodeoxyribonuclease V subunit alpha [Deltaproteobacteria bacterium]